MTIKEAKEILVRYNKWRRGFGYDASIEMPDPKGVGIAIDTVVNSETYSKDDIENSHDQGYKEGYEDGWFEATH